MDQVSIPHIYIYTQREAIVLFSFSSPLTFDRALPLASTAYACLNPSSMFPASP